MQKTYQSKSGGGYFFAGLLFALVLGGGGYWMLHKGTLTVEKPAPRKPDIAILDARAKPHFDRATQNIPAVVEGLTSYSSMVKFCYLASCDKLTGSNRVQEYLASVINARIIDPCRKGAKVYGCDVNPASFQQHLAELNSDAVTASAYAASGLMLEAVFLKSTVKAFTSVLGAISSRLAAAYGTGAACAVADGPFPIGDTIAVLLATGGTAWCAYDLWQAKAQLHSELTAVLLQSIDSCRTASRKVALE